MIQLTRRIRTAGNSFGGVIAASFDSSLIGRLYQSYDTGRNGSVSLIGADGIFRAGVGFEDAVTGLSIPRNETVEHFKQAPVGHFFDSGKTIDGIKRLVSYRAVDGSPLFVTIGLSHDEIFEENHEEARLYYAAAAALTLCILAVMAFGVWHAVRLRRARAEIETRTRNFQSALEYMPQGLAMFDADKRLLMCNEQYRRMYDDAEQFLRPGVTMMQIREQRVGRNLYRDPGTLQSLRGENPESLQDKNEIRELGDGRFIAVTVAPIAGGGFVATHTDVTDTRRREASFQLMFNNNPVPMWVYDVGSLRFLAVNEAAISHYGYSRDQFLSMTALDIRPIESRTSFASFVQTSGGVHNGEQTWRHQISDGTKIDVAIYARALNYERHSASLVAAIDVTERIKAEEEVRQAKAFLNSVIENMPIMVTVKNADDGRYVLVNRAGEKLFGFSATDMIGRQMRDLVPSDAAERIQSNDHAVFNTGRIVTYEHSMQSEDGERLLSVKKLPIWGREGNPQYVLTISEDVTEQRSAEQQIVHMARHDALTELANRALFTSRIDKAAARCRRNNRHFAVHILDLDHFKQVNDSLGHPVGDALLKLIAQRLLACTSASDTVARLGGDEFAILQVTEGDPREGAVVLASRILEAVIAPCDLDGQKVIVGASIGVAVAPEHGGAANLLMKRADLALYRIKADGRNGFQFFEPEMEVNAHARRALETDLREAIAREQFEVHYQPVILAASRKTVGVEALVRWRHPQRGTVSPVDFIPLAEETGLIVPLGDWILRKVCADAAAWPTEIKVAVNLSPAQFNKSNLFEVVADVLADSGLAPERLEVEITETVLLHQNEANLAVLHHLRDLGVAIVLDDFGTGYSSLSYLRMFPFDKIKIDRSFVNEMTTRADCAAIVCAVIGMAKSLNVITTAEGVETEEQYSLLRATGCTQVQGYLFSPAVPASKLEFTRAANGRDEAKVA